MSIPMQYSLELFLEGPLLSSATGVMQAGLDVSMQRYRDIPVLNGSLIRGNIRHALNSFAEALDADQAASLKKSTGRWFGQQSDDAELEPQRARVMFDVFWQLQSPEQSQKSSRTRISIDADGQTKDRHLQVVEDVLGSGAQAIFSGTLRAYFNNTDEQADFEHWMHKALAFIPALGNQKGVGFGRLLKANLTCVDQAVQALVIPSSSAVEQLRIGIALRFKFPFCIGAPRTNDSNRIESIEEIPGQVLKAVIAEQLDNDPQRLEKELCFDQLGIGFARPAQTNPPLALPLSLAKIDKKFVDLSAVNDASKQSWKHAPSFQPDWKADDWYNATTVMLQGTDKPKRYLLVRTGMNAETLQSADNQLFALDCVDPDGYEWFADIDLSRIAETRRVSVLKNLQQIFARGLSGIGKTKAHAKVRILPASQVLPQTPLQAWKNNQWLVLLASPTRMLPPGFSCSGINSQSALSTAYQAYWNTISAGSLSMQQYFAQQQRVGGAYYQRRFQHKQSYQPEWLSNAGSVFVLQSVDSDKAIACLQDWLLSGLPPYNADDATWQTTPYIAEHGYGEIRVNLPQQIALTQELGDL